MFLENKYFSYDGTAKTADIIKQVREKIGMTGKNKYGEVPTDKLDKKLKSDLGITIGKDFSSKYTYIMDLNEKQYRTIWTRTSAAWQIRRSRI